MRTDFLEMLQKYYDAPTLCAWIARYEGAEGKRQQAQVSQWHRVLATLEKVEHASSLPGCLLHKEKPLIYAKFDECLDTVGQ